MENIEHLVLRVTHWAWSASSVSLSPRPLPFLGQGKPVDSSNSSLKGLVFQLSRRRWGAELGACRIPRVFRVTVSRANSPLASCSLEAARRTGPSNAGWSHQILALAPAQREARGDVWTGLAGADSGGYSAGKRRDGAETLKCQSWGEKPAVRIFSHLRAAGLA